MTAQGLSDANAAIVKVTLSDETLRTIAIDGTSRVGKGTTANLLAKHYRLLHIDSGAIFRVVTLEVMARNIPLTEHEEIADLIYLVNSERLKNPVIRTPNVSAFVPQVAKIPELRARVRDKQRELVLNSRRGAVVEGRDIATNVLPDAHVKIFLDASPRERARRARNELAWLGIEKSLKEIEQDIKDRDYEDMSRLVNPLTLHPEAFRIDSSYLVANTVLQRICAHIESRFENF